jgi:hypothetical protein
MKERERETSRYQGMAQDGGAESEDSAIGGRSERGERGMIWKYLAPIDAAAEEARECLWWLCVRCGVLRCAVMFCAMLFCSVLSCIVCVCVSLRFKMC